MVDKLETVKETEISEFEECMATTRLDTAAARAIAGHARLASVFRRGPARTNRTRSLAIFGNLFLHLLPVKVREKSLRVRATYYLGSISLSSSLSC